MNFSPLQQINNIVNATQTPQSQDALRRAATQFEAVLLMQLTSVLNNTNNDDEDALFGGDGGSGLAKQMFSEQLATTMAQSGGVGLADLILQQFGGTPTNKVPGNANALSNVITAVKDIRESAATQTTPQNTSQTTTSPLINKSGEVNPVTNEVITNNSDEAVVISRYEDDVKNDNYDDPLNPVTRTGETVNSTRPRIVPNASVTQVQTVSSNTVISNRSNTTTAITYQMPVNGRLSSSFGNRFHPIDKRVKFHGGIDIAVPTGTPIGAAAEGVVTFAGWRGGYGNLIIIQHADGRETRYAHLSKIQVSEGDKVSIGQQIALSGSTGKSTGPHLHFEVRENGQVVNPFKFVSNVLPKTAER